MYAIRSYYVQLDRAVVNHWGKAGYIPARWASEVERVTQGRIPAADIVNEASAKKPVRVKSRPDDAPFGIAPESQAMTQFAPAKRITSFHPPQRTLIVITSYSIHYTKLYDRSRRRQPLGADRLRPRALGGRSRARHPGRNNFV